MSEANQKRISCVISFINRRVAYRAGHKKITLSHLKRNRICTRLTMLHAYNTLKLMQQNVDLTLYGHIKNAEQRTITAIR